MCQVKYGQRTGQAEERARVGDRGHEELGALEK